jgi:hypothetical protein
MKIAAARMVLIVIFTPSLTLKIDIPSRLPRLSNYFCFHVSIFIVFGMHIPEENRIEKTSGLIEAENPSSFA